MRRLSITLVPTAVLAALALAGCSSTQSSIGLGTTGASTTTATLGVSLPPDRALAALPADAGQVVSVVERRTTDDGLTQTITLAGDPGSRGDDRIEVTRRDRSLMGVRSRIDAETIETEMADALPGVAMTVSPRVVTTPTGPVGVATGPSAGGTNCLYAWSNAEARGRSTPSARFLGLQIASVTTEEMSVRIRLCRRGYSDERLIALAEGLRLRTDGAVTGPIAGTGRAVGSDALASAGYAGTVAPQPVAALPAYVPSAPVAPRRVVDRAPPAPRKTAVARVGKPAPQAAAPAPEQPAASVAAPIPLPSGG